MPSARRPPWLRFVAAALAGSAIAMAGAFALAEGGSAGRSPDPAGVATRTQWVFEIRYEKGRPTIERVRAVTAKHPSATARVMGRFALELYVGPELLDRLRFNVPLTADPPDPAHQRKFHRPTFENVSTRVRAVMADSPRAAWGLLVDRATGEEQRFWWPPEPDGRLLPMAPRKDEARHDEAPDAGASPPADAAPPPKATDAGPPPRAADAG